MRLTVLTLVMLLVLTAAEGNASYKMDVYKGSPGVYFENLGHATLSNTAWTIIVYVPLQAIDNETSNFRLFD
jgi:hypothetical protein